MNQSNTTNIDWSTVLIRSSAVGYLFVEPQSKAAKDAGELSKTSQAYLINEYIRLKYGRDKDVVTPQMSKGIEAEYQSINILSMHQNKVLEKNEKRLNNSYVTGLPDVFEGETIENCLFLWDIKTSWSIWTLLGNIPDKLEPIYYYQLQCYMWLCNCHHAAIAYVLADCPQNLIEAEKKKLFYQMNVATELSPEYQEAAAALEINLIYPDIPIEEKVLIYPVERDEEVIEKIKIKIGKARQFLYDFETNHLQFNTK